ncbi:MAG: VCBS repeat-containing protein [Gammaproteobacteria bacterium]|nr:VCBS repeat-containing protein [Gammaproteobacteria bacterium]
MKSIVTKFGTTVVREYTLGYQPTTDDKPLSRLTSVQVCANDNPGVTDATECLPATTFAWQDYPRGFDEVVNTARSVDRYHDSTHTMDVNGDGLDDLVYEHDQTWRILIATGSGFKPEVDTQISTSMPINYYRQVATTPFDYDGDGRMDLAVEPHHCTPHCPSVEVRVLKSNPNRDGFMIVDTGTSYEEWEDDSGMIKPLAGDVDGDGRTDQILIFPHAPSDSLSSRFCATLAARSCAFQLEFLYLGTWSTPCAYSTTMATDARICWAFKHTETACGTSTSPLDEISCISTPVSLRNISIWPMLMAMVYKTQSSSPQANSQFV